MNLADRLFAPLGGTGEEGLSANAQRVLAYLQEQDAPRTIGRLVHDTAMSEPIARLALKELTQAGLASGIGCRRRYAAIALPPESAT